MKLWKGIFDKLDRGTMLKDLCALIRENPIPQYIERKSNEHQKDMGNTITALK